MNLRYEILLAASRNPGAPAQDIADAIDADRKKVQWACRDAHCVGLLDRKRDDVTGLPGYTLTQSGRDRIAEGPASQRGGDRKKRSATSGTPQPAVGNNTGSARSATSPRAVSTEACAVQSPAPVPAAAAAPGAEDDIEQAAEPAAIPSATEMLVALNAIRAELDDHACPIGELAKRVRIVKKVATSQEKMLDEVEEALAERVSGDIDPSDLTATECAAKAAQRIDAMDAELLAQAAVVVDLRDQLQAAQRTAARLEHALQTCRAEAITLGELAAVADASGYAVVGAHAQALTLDEAKRAAVEDIASLGSEAKICALVPVLTVAQRVVFEPA